VVKSAALLHKVTSSDYRTWPTAEEVLWAGTRGGARSARVAGDVGAIAPGYKADFVLLDLRSLNFTPLNDLPSHLVYVENGDSITEVWVNGQPVVRDGRCLLIDEQAVLDELRGLAQEYLGRHAKVEELNRAFEPHFAEIHRRCCAEPIGINRFSGDEAGWVSGP
jgi:cytosine/adenosine deaminase-related metal-dependent hydrolase